VNVIALAYRKSARVVSPKSQIQLLNVPQRPVMTLASFV
jgi:hypothetical protein